MYNTDILTPEALELIPQLIDGFTSESMIGVFHWMHTLRLIKYFKPDFEKLMNLPSDAKVTVLELIRQGLVENQQNRMGECRFTVSFQGQCWCDDALKKFSKNYSEDQKDLLHLIFDGYYDDCPFGHFLKVLHN